jgi:Hint domain
VRTIGGATRRIAWIGVGHLLAVRGRRNAATPIIVRKGALADNVPHSDLRVTKGHAVYIDGVLIPVEFLVNHRSIMWDDHAQEVALYHIELETHDVVLANGAPMESYRDDGNRWLFRNANTGWALPPKEPCAPVLTGGYIVDEAWRRLLERAGPRPGFPLTDDPDLHLLVDGMRIDPVCRDDLQYVFRLATRPNTVRVGSRASAPQELGLARDPRALGVALQEFVVTQSDRELVIDAADERLTEGFHEFEADGGIRWTDGDASLPESLFAEFIAPLQITIRLGCRTIYDEGLFIHRAA